MNLFTYAQMPRRRREEFVEKRFRHGREEHGRIDHGDVMEAAVREAELATEPEKSITFIC